MKNIKYDIEVGYGSPFSRGMARLRRYQCRLPVYVSPQVWGRIEHDSS